MTGASAGIGEALARRLARDKRSLVLVARRADRLEVLGRELTAQHGVQVHVVAQDLAQTGAAERVLAEVERRGLTVDWLINNAGFGTYGRFAELPVARELEEIRLNVETLVEFTGRCVPGMVARRRGAIINIASVGAFAPSPYMATYAATKAFVLSFTEALAYEVRDAGVHVLCVCPGFTRTEFQDHAHVDTSSVPSMAWMTADEVADETVRAVGRKTVLVNGVMNSLTVGMTKLVPRGLLTRSVGAMMGARGGLK